MAQHDVLDEGEPGRPREGGAAVWVPDLADAAWMSETLSRHTESLGLPDRPVTAQLVDVRLTNPHRPESSRSRGWATYHVTSPQEAPLLLYLKGFPDRAAGRAALD